MTASSATRSTVSLKPILWVIGLAMAATAVYMMFIIREVPKTVSNSKAGLFAELVDRLLIVYEKGEGLQPGSDYQALNETLSKKFRESPWKLRASASWTLDAWADTAIHDRPLLLARYHDAQKRALPWPMCGSAITSPAATSTGRTVSSTS